MGSQTQEGLPQGEYQPKMSGVEGIIMSWNQGAKGGGKSNLRTRAEGASDTKIRIISSGPPQERGQMRKTQRPVLSSVGSPWCGRIWKTPTPLPSICRSPGSTLG